MSERVTSPTFTIVRQHEAHNDLGIRTLHHADVYRIQSLDEVLDLALGELVEGSAVAIVEWGGSRGIGFWSRGYRRCLYRR